MKSARAHALAFSSCCCLFAVEAERDGHGLQPLGRKSALDVASFDGLIECLESLFGKLQRGVVAVALPRQLAPSFTILVGDENMAIRAASTLLSHGIFIPAIRYPSVARGHARLRLTVTAGHTEADLAELGKAAENLKLGICSH